MIKWIGVFVSISCTIITYLSFFIIFKTVKDALLACLIVAVISMIVLMLYMHFDTKAQIEKLKKQIRHLKTDVEKEQSKNEALSEQYKDKKKKLETTEKYWFILNDVFLNAISGTAKERFQVAYKQYLDLTDYINKED